jgi:aquaglyceroporin related protein, other eukaryote
MTLKDLRTSRPKIPMRLCGKLSISRSFFLLYISLHFIFILYTVFSFLDIILVIIMSYENFSSPGNGDATGTGNGPSLRDPEDKIQKSDSAYKMHMDKASEAVPSGPGMKNSPESYSSPPQHLEDSHNFDNTETIRASTLDLPEHKDLQHRSTMSKLRTYMGLEPEAPIMEGHDVHAHLTWSSVRVIMREPFAEFFGTFIMILFGNGSVAQVLLSTGETTAPGGNGFGQYQSISWGWGLGVMLGIYVAGDSGGFLNPAITLCFCLYRKLPWRRLPIYFLAQVLGAFCASAVVYANYITAIDQVNGHGIRTVPPAKGATAGKPNLYFLFANCV